MTTMPGSVALSIALLLLTWPLSVISQGTTLAGVVVTRTDVKKWADLSLDVRDMVEELNGNNNGSPAAGLAIYQEGRNAESSPGVKLTLQQLSTELAGLGTSATPSFLYHMYGLADRATDPQSLASQARYADNYVKSTITSKPEQAGEAIISLNMWMYATHLLYKGIDTCHKMAEADNPQQLDLGGGGMDEFIGLWIGRHQQAGTDDGSSLYALAQMAGGLFGTTSPEAAVNNALISLYQEGAAVLSFPDACSSTNLPTVSQLWSIVQRMISQMHVPLMQLLIDALLREDAESVSLYARALVPQVSQCRPSIYKRLKENLLGNSVSFAKKQEILRDLQDVYGCLGFTCADVGSYSNGELKVEQCTFPPLEFRLAGYGPVSRVLRHSMIDHDILQIKILTSMGSYSFAKYLYSYGRNSPKEPDNEGDPYDLRSLKKFATTSERQAANPFYNEFVLFHNDPSYADTTVQQALNGKGTWGSASAEVRAEVVSLTCSYQIMYMYALAEMGDAIADCSRGNAFANEAGEHSWDEVAAYLIGSMEGPNLGGSPDNEDGQLIWNLANRRAFQFQTLNDMGYSYVNSDLEDLLFAGKGELDAFDCVNLEKTVTKIQHHILIPIIQSTLRYAINNELLEATTSRPDLAIGETFALSVLPIVNFYDQASAEVIQENMIFRPDVKPVREGPQVVADAFYEIVDEFGIGCHDIGATQQADVCRKEGGFKPRVSSSTSTRTIGLTATLGGVVLMLMHLIV